MTQTVEMDPKLMPPPGMGIRLNDRILPESFLNFKLGFGLFPPIIDSHSSRTELPEGANNRSSGALDVPVQHGKIRLRHFTTAEFIIQKPMRPCVSSKENDTADFLIKTMHHEELLSPLSLE